MRTAEDARTNPQPGDRYEYAGLPRVYVTVLSRTADTLYARTRHMREPWRTANATVTVAQWAARVGTYVAVVRPPVPACLTCAKSRSRATACGDVPANATACPRYYPRTGA